MRIVAAEDEADDDEADDDEADALQPLLLQWLAHDAALATRDA